MYINTQICKVSLTGQEMLDTMHSMKTKLMFRVRALINTLG